MSKQREAMKQALHALQTKGEHHRFVYDAMKALAEALAEPEPEPVAWIVTKAMASPRIQEWKPKDGDYLTCEPLYITPPARKPLTDEELLSIWRMRDYRGYSFEFARAIERAHGIGEV